MKEKKKSFDPRKFIIKLEKKRKLPDGSWETVEVDYLPVAARILWFRTEHPLEEGWGIKTKIEAIAEGKVRCLAMIVDPQGRKIAMGRKTESQANFSDFIEKAETGAIGRALALCGYGTQFSPELDEGERIVDAPVEVGKKKEKEKINFDEIAKRIT